MKPETAIKLITSYSNLTRGIADAKKRIGVHMDLCKGYSGKRGDVDAQGWPVAPRGEEDQKGREKDMHLWTWYQPEWDDYENPSYEKITQEIHGQQCPHCYAAHLAIQERKAMRKSLGSVKAAMTRLGSK